MVVVVKCEVCEVGALVEVDGEDGLAGFLCEAASEAERESGSGCGALVPAEDVSERRRTAEKDRGKGSSLRKPPSSTARAPTKKRRLLPCSEDEEEEEEEEEGEEEGGGDVSDGSAGVGKESRVVASIKVGAAKSRRLGIKAKTQPLLPSSTSRLSSLSSSTSASDPLSFHAKVKQRALARLSSSALDLDDHQDESLSSLNSSALLTGELRVQRAPLMSSLSIKGEEDPLASMYRRPFVRPRVSGQPSKEAAKVMMKEKWGRRLGMRFRGTGVLGPMKPLMASLPLPVTADVKVDSAEAVAVVRQKEGFQPLIIWEQNQLSDEERAKYPGREWSDSIEVPPIIARFLRPHQREGVQFMAECVLGLRRFRGAGAILADDMGLGKTLQSIALLYTLLTQGFDKGRSTARRVLIVTPTSLVANWRNEIRKWLEERVSAIAISESSKGDVVDAVSSFLHPRSTTSVLIISYDTFRLHSALFMKASDACDLMICDEAHRLKNSKTSTYTALDALPCRRRILLSGTPLQNNLDEFYAMINFTNGGCLGDRKMFRRYYEGPILIGREPQADSEEQREGMERSAELSAIVNQFVLRRTNTLLSAHLPPKVMQVVCCRPTTLQMRLYDQLLKSKEVKRMVKGEDGAGGTRTDVLPLITALRKLCNHPKLIHDEIRGVARPDDDGVAATPGSSIARILKGCEPLFRDSGFARAPSHAQWSGKMYVLERLLAVVRRTTDDRVVIVATSTSALDVIGELCNTAKWPFLRLDGATSIKTRQKLVDQLTDRSKDVFCFLLSSRAGGCGLNLIGANRLILFDCDWNPAVDKQAAARVWRDGQAKRCFIYRFLTTGTIEEKMYQRQLSKEGLAEVLGGGMNEAACSRDELKALFHIRAAESASDTHDHLQCDCLDGLLTSAEEAEQKKKQMMAEMEPQQQQQQQSAAADADGQQDASPVLEEVQSLDPLPAPASSPVPSEASDSEPDADDDDGFIVEEGDGSSDDFDGAPQRKSTAKAAKKKAKGAKARRSLKTSLVLDPLLLSSISRAMIGQRGSPPEEELINWAHHITGMSAPDPLLRQALSSMNRTKDHHSYVSFIFSCEVKGKQIGAMGEAVEDDDGEEVETAETKAFRQFSARCSLPPVMKEKTTGVSISADDALEKHRKMIEEHEKRRRKRLGFRDDDAEGGGGGAVGHGRRHSSRLTTRQNLSEDALAAEQLEGDEGRRKRGDDAAAGVGVEVGVGGDVVDPSVLAEADPETAAMIQALLRGEDGQEGGGRKKRKRAGKKEKETKMEEDKEEGDAADQDGRVDVASSPEPQSRAAPARSEAKAVVKVKAREEESDDGENEGGSDGGDDSSVELLSMRREKVRPPARGEQAPALPPLPRLSAVDNDDDADFFI